jgi:signal transduction histidine kinase
MSGEPPEIHQLKNQLSIIVGFCDLLLTDLPQGDPKRADLEEIRKAGQAALELIPDVAARMR